MEGKNDWIQQLLENDFTPEEREKVYESLGDEDKVLFRKLERFKQESEDTSELSREEVLSIVMEKVADESVNPATQSVPFYLNPRFVSWLAATVAVVIGIYFFFNYFGEKHFYIPNAHMETVLFPDDSRAVLNAHSRLVYDQRNFYKDRKVDLQGEAFFDVKAGEPFEVETRSGAVFVLGTEFNVLVRNREFQVKCLSGKVKVVLEDMNNSVELGPGQATRLTERRLSEPYEVNKTHIGSWQNGEFRFNSDPLSLVITELERQFDVQIKAEDIDGLTFTGYFTNTDLKKALEQVLTPMQLDYDIIDKKLVIVRS